MRLNRDKLLLLAIDLDKSQQEISCSTTRITLYPHRRQRLYGRQAVNATDRVDTETVHTLPGPQQEGLGIILDLASGFEAQFSKPSISSGNPPSSTIYFTRKNARTESKVLEKQVVVPKDKRVPPGSREFGAHYSAATKALDHMFGADKHFVPTSREGETDNPIIIYKKCMW